MVKMRGLSFISAFLLILISQPPNTVSATSITRYPGSKTRRHYAKAHSLRDGHDLNSGEWHTVNVTDLGYKYDQPTQDKRSSKTSTKATADIGGTVSHLINDVWNGLKGIGDPQQVKITWYTGHDLLNPSCWKKIDWAPSDESFACALTLEGWNDQPKCFKFLELCNGPKKCVFVRVVDSCAGCAPGSKHVDLTKGAFSQLADPDQGVLNVQMRQASDPHEWYEDLWGPKL